MQNYSQIATLSSTQNSEIHQVFKPDYTGVFSFCFTIFIIGIIFITIINYWANKVYKIYKTKSDEEINFIKRFYTSLEEKVERINNINKEIIEELRNDI